MSQLTITQEIYTALTSNSTLMAKITGVFDVVPEGQASPYISLGYQQAVRGRLLNESENTWYFNIDIWSNYQGRKEVLELAELVVQSFKPEWFLDELVVLQDEDNWSHAVVTVKGYDCN